MNYAHEQIETARLDFYWIRLRNITDPQQIWKKLSYLGILPNFETNMADFSAKDLNTYFASVSFDLAALALSDFLVNLENKKIVVKELILDK